MSIVKFLTTLFLQGVMIFVCHSSSGQTSLLNQPQNKPYLDVSISLFTENVPADEQVQRLQNIYPQVRRAESRYMPALLRATLQNSDKWGAIRIIPEQDVNAELMISAAIIYSDGGQLEIDLQAVDSSGRVWVNKSYSEIALEGISLMEEGLNIDPFQALYNEVLFDLSQIYEQLNGAEIEQIKNISFLRFASFLSEDSFAQYLQLTPEGIYQLTRLPASNDPMVARIMEIRQHQYLYVDAVDQQFQQFLISVKPVYDLWRKYSVELRQNSIDYQARQQTERQFSRGTYRDLREGYDNYKWQKMQESYLDELSLGFNNEVEPTDIDLEDSIYHLSGTMENQYQQWQQILKDLFELEQF